LVFIKDRFVNISFRTVDANRCGPGRTSTGWPDRKIRKALFYRWVPRIRAT